MAAHNTYNTRKARFPGLAPATPIATTATTIVVVDDNIAMRQMAEAMLATGERACITVADSISALCVLVEHHCQAVVLDADSGPLLPWQFVKLLQQHPLHQSTRLVYTSTRDDVIERARAMAAGIELFLPKPFTCEELLAAVDGTLVSTA